MDEFELHALEWSAQERLRHHARSITERFGLEPEHAERVEEAAETGDADELQIAVADFLASLAGAEQESTE